MKNLIILAASIMLLGFNCFGQGRGLDLFGIPRSIVIQAPVQLSATVNNTTNTIDTHGFDGLAVIDIGTLTNGVNAGLTVAFNQSVDKTNWTALQNYAIATALSQTYTNLLYGTNLTQTQTTLYPGTVVTPTAGTAGWATAYLLPAPYTNSGTLTVSSNAFYEIGYNVADAQRYLQVIWTGTNAAVSALFKGFRGQ